MTGTEGDALPAETRVGRVALAAADLDSLADFYCEVVGLAELERGGGRALLGAPGGSVLLVLLETDDPARSAGAAGLFHAAFRVPDRAALADAATRVRQRWHLDGASDHLVSEALYLSDPEDNGVEIYCDRPREDWPRPPDGGGVRMETHPLEFDALPAGRGDDEVPSEADVGHVHLEVTSLPESEAFYRAFGMGVQARYGEEAAFLAAGDYHHHVGLNTWNRRTAPASGRGLAWVEFLVPGDALGAALGRLEEHGAAVDRRGTDENHGAAARVPDPDGIELRLTEG